MMEFDNVKFNLEASQLLKLFNDQWLFTNHLRAMQKSDEFWYKYNKFTNNMTKEEVDIFNTISFESTYRKKYLQGKEMIQYEKWLDKLIPDTYFDKKYGTNI